MSNIKNKQKLERRNTYTPTDAPQVWGNCDSSLNREETLSVPNLKTLSNNPDVDLPQPAGGLKAVMQVFILNMDGKPLMPCKPAKAKHLLKEHKSKIVQHSPFTIQLLWQCESDTQDVILGIDSGYKHIGFSAVTAQRELLFGEVTARIDMPKLNIEKSMYRRKRRNKLWYRKPRFLNRGRKGGEWFAPSINHKLETHIRLIEKIKSIIPVSRVVIEVASFDTHKMKNPEISGVEYQHGELMGYKIREYLLEKFQRKCAYCGKENVPLEIEHITPKSRGGSNTVDNLAIACHSCNQKKNNLTAEEFGHLEVRNEVSNTLKDSAFMNTVRWKLKELTGADYSFGYMTKKNRILYGIDKSHANDAFVIAGGNKQVRSPVYGVSQRRRNNRTLQLNRKGFRPSLRRKRYSMQPGDIVEYNNSIWNVSGVHNYGKRVVIRDGDKKMDVNIKKVKMVRYGKGLQFKFRFLPTLMDGVSSGVVR